MTTYEPLDSGVEVNGQAVLSVVNSFPDGSQSQGEQILANHGIKDPTDDEWYPQEAWLGALGELTDKLGQATVETIGREIPRSADWPPGTNTIVGGIASIDLAYQMNHRNGEIGNYEAEGVEGDRIHIVCDNPYPCQFDIGIIKGVIDEFGDEQAQVMEIGDTCREEGEESCKYEVKL